MTLLKELIDIQEHVNKGQFVLRLTEGVTDPKGTLDAYVVTPQLERCFDDALCFSRSSRPEIRESKPLARPAARGERRKTT
jgi:hypothetical protein